MKDYEVSVLGTTYSVKYQTPEENSKLNGNDGLAELYSKEIILNPIVADADSFNNLYEYANKTVRHELIHAFLFESGLWKYSKDEVLVDMLAIQMPKMVKAMQEAGCL